MAFQNPFDVIVQLVLGFFFANNSDKQWEQFNQDVQDRIDAGRDLYTARIETAMDMLDNDPNLGEARDVYEELYRNFPDKVKEQFDSVVQGFRDNRGEFDQRTADLAAGYRQREADVTGLLDRVGQQELRDIRRRFGEERAAALSDQARRGLAGSGAAASLGGGFTTREADAIARSREAQAVLKADALARLRGDTLGFGEGANQFSAGLGTLANTANQEGAALGLGYEADFGTNFANFNYDLGTLGLDTFLNTTGDFGDFIVNGIQDVPPDTSATDQFTRQFGRGLVPNP